MPGIDLFTRRRTRLCRYWKAGKRKVLDAGFGNGWFSYLAYRSGAFVTAVNIAQDQFERAADFYHRWKKIPRARLQFKNMNLYALDMLEPGFDEIICYETLEHIKNDRKVCESFWRLLREGGALHLCCPFSEHPRWKNEVLDLNEAGGHVRAGYTLETYRALLEPIGFHVVEKEGIGGSTLTKAALLVRRIQNRFGILLALPVAFLSFPLVWFDPPDAKNPYCFYIRAVKRRESC